MLERAGAQILTCHGRLREQRGQNTGLASYKHIKAVKEAVSVPVFANGNILFSTDIQRCLEETGADGVMSAEGVLYNPAIFNFTLPSPSSASPSSCTPRIPELHNPPLADLALEYLSIVRSQRTRTTPSGVKGHLFKFLRPGLVRERYHDLREKLGKVKLNVPRTAEEGKGWVWVDKYVEVVEEVKARLEEDAREATDNGRIPLEQLITKCPKTGLDLFPWWIAQPYFRPLPPPAEGKAAKKAKATAPPHTTKTSETGTTSIPLETLHDSTNEKHDTVASTIPAKRPPEQVETDAKRAKVDLALHMETQTHEDVRPA
ncbi:hypothetical protein H0H93_001060 [Arthromyces matolae]|nr:hypothetical protein H0H93_001060 [Arthromyces matolae]